MCKLVNCGFRGRRIVHSMSAAHTIHVIPHVACVRPMEMLVEYECDGQITEVGRKKQVDLAEFRHQARGDDGQ
jgi:hypothetical protein